MSGPIQGVVFFRLCLVVYFSLFIVTENTGKMVEITLCSITVQNNQSDSSKISFYESIIPLTVDE